MSCSSFGHVLRRRKVHIIQIHPACLPKTQIGYIDFKGGRGGQTGQGYFTIIIYIRLFSFFAYSDNLKITLTTLAKIIIGRKPLPKHAFSRSGMDACIPDRTLTNWHSCLTAMSFRCTFRQITLTALDQLFCQSRKSSAGSNGKAASSSWTRKPSTACTRRPSARIRLSMSFRNFPDARKSRQKMF